MADFHESAFESELCEYLASHGWRYSTNDLGYDRARALFPKDVIGWLEDTQPDELAKVVKPGAHEDRQKGQLLDRLVKVLDSPLTSGGGTLNVLRGGFQSAPARFTMGEPKPESTKNPGTVKRHELVRLRVMRQVHFSTADTRSIDLVFFVNGIPVATAELKTDYTQSVAEA